MRNSLANVNQKLMIFILNIINFSFVFKWFEPKAMLEEFKYIHIAYVYSTPFNTIIITFFSHSDCYFDNK